MGTGKVTFRTALLNYDKAVQYLKSVDKLLVVVKAPKQSTHDMVFVMLRRSSAKECRVAKVRLEEFLAALDDHQFRSAFGCVDASIAQWRAVGKTENEAVEHIGFDWRD